jgi:hypothetical protein
MVKKGASMISRRTVLNGTALGSALAALTPTALAEAGGAEALQANSDRVNVTIDISAITSSINALRSEVTRQDTFWEIEPVRREIKTFLRQAGKYPDYIEVGTDVWHQVYDWHVRYQQPMSLARTAEGRYTILLYSTQVIMRTELAANYVGPAYDNR